MQNQYLYLYMREGEDVAKKIFGLTSKTDQEHFIGKQAMERTREQALEMALKTASLSKVKKVSEKTVWKQVGQANPKIPTQLAPPKKQSLLKK